MADQTINIQPQSDHDAIVTLVSEVRQIRTDIKDVKQDIRELADNVANRVSDLEQEKLDKEEANRLLADAAKVHGDFENRIRFIERYMWGALALIGLLNFLGFGGLLWLLQQP